MINITKKEWWGIHPTCELLICTIKFKLLNESIRKWDHFDTIPYHRITLCYKHLKKSTSLIPFPKTSIKPYIHVASGSYVFTKASSLHRAAVRSCTICHYNTPSQWALLSLPSQHNNSKSCFSKVSISWFTSQIIPCLNSLAPGA